MRDSTRFKRIITQPVLHMYVIITDVALTESVFLRQDLTSSYEAKPLNAECEALLQHPDLLRK